MSKVWFITGAGSGIGAGIAKAALKAGDRVVATARNLDKARKVLVDVAGDDLALVQLDVTSEAQAKAAVAEAVERFGRIDVVINNAGYSLLGNFEESTVPDIEAQFATNFYGVVHVMRAVLPVMREQRSGHIINIGSSAGAVGLKHCSAYSATKFAIEGLALSVGIEVEPFGIKITTVEPGMFRTDLLDSQNVRYVREQHRRLRPRGPVGVDVVGLPRHAARRSGQARRGHPRGCRHGKPAEGVCRRKRRDRDDHAGNRGTPRATCGATRNCPDRRTVRSDHRTPKSRGNKMKNFAIGAVAAITIALGATGYAQESTQSTGTATADVAQPLGYMIANYEIKDQETYQEYIEAAGPLAPQYGGRIIVFNLDFDQVEGDLKVGHGHRRVSEPCRRRAVLQFSGIYGSEEAPRRFDRRHGRDHRGICSSATVI